MTRVRRNARRDKKWVRKLAETVQGIRAEDRRCLDRLGFDWRDLPRIEHERFSSALLAAPATFELTLDDGRQVSLRRWHQYFVYSGQLCGLPWDPEHGLIAAVATAERLFPGSGAHLVVLPPALHVGPNRVAERYPALPPLCVALPKVCTIAEFEAGAPARDPGKCYSSLVIAWFQEHYGLPEDPHVLAQLRAVDWTLRADDWTP